MLELHQLIAMEQLLLSLHVWTTSGGPGRTSGERRWRYIEALTTAAAARRAWKAVSAA